MPFDSRTQKVAKRLSREISKTAGLVARIPLDREARSHPEIRVVLLAFQGINAILARGVREGTITAAQQARIGGHFAKVGSALRRKSAPRRKTRSRPKR